MFSSCINLKCLLSKFQKIGVVGRFDFGSGKLHEHRLINEMHSFIKFMTIIIFSYSVLPVSCRQHVVLSKVKRKPQKMGWLLSCDSLSHDSQIKSWQSELLVKKGHSYITWTLSSEVHSHFSTLPLSLLSQCLYDRLVQSTKMCRLAWNSYLYFF